MNTQSLSDVKNRALQIVKSEQFKRQALSFAVTVVTVVAVRVTANLIADAIENKLHPTSEPMLDAPATDEIVETPIEEQI